MTSTWVTWASGFSVSSVSHPVGRWVASASGDVLRDFFQNSTAIICLFLFIVSYCWLLLESVIWDDRVLAGGILAVLGLSIFNLGCRSCLLLGEDLGLALLHKGSKVLYLSVFSLGFLCTMGEPTLAVLQEAAMARVYRRQSPLLWALVHQPIRLLVALSLGVALASLLGCIRLIWRQSIKRWLVIALLATLVLSVACAHRGSSMYSALGFAWDCGPATIGPLTSPILLSLGIGMAAPIRRRPSDQEEAPVDDLAGFGLIAFSSLLPVMAVWILALCLGDADAVWTQQQDLRKNLQKGSREPDVLSQLESGLLRASECVLPSMGCLLFLHYAFMESRDLAKIMVSFGASFLGMTMFLSGLEMSLSNLSAKASVALVSVTSDSSHRYLGTFAVALYSFVVAGFAACCEPQLKALGNTVETMSRGEIRKDRLLLAVTLGVGFGSSVGSCALMSGRGVTSVLMVGYGFCLVLTLLADEATVAISWDVAGLTNGPVTASVVVSNGLILQNQQDGFGILSCCSLGAILAVLMSGVLRSGGRSRARTWTWTEMRTMLSSEHVI